MNIGIQAAAEGRPEIAFWPAAGMALIFSEHGGYMNVAFLIILLLTGGINYTLLKRFRKAAKQSQENTRRRARNSRTESPTIEDRFKSAADAVEPFLPNNAISAVIVVISFIINLMFAAYLFIIYMIKIAQNPTPDLTTIGIFVIPIIYIFIIFSIIIWNV